MAHILISTPVPLLGSCFLPPNLLHLCQQGCLGSLLGGLQILHQALTQPAAVAGRKRCLGIAGIHCILDLQQA